MLTYFGISVRQKRDIGSFSSGGERGKFSNLLPDQLGELLNNPCFTIRVLFHRILPQKNSKILRFPSESCVFKAKISFRAMFIV